MHDDVTSVAPSSTVNMMRRPIHPLPGITRSKTNRPSGPVVDVVVQEDARYVIPVRVAAGDVERDRHIRGRHLSDPKGSFHPGPRFQVDDPGRFPFGRRFDVSIAGGMQ